MLYYKERISELEARTEEILQNEAQNNKTIRHERNETKKIEWEILAYILLLPEKDTGKSD